MKNKRAFLLFFGIGILILSIVTICYIRFYGPSETKTFSEQGQEVSPYLADDLYRLLYDDRDYGSILAPYYQYDEVLPTTLTNRDINRLLIVQLSRMLGENPSTTMYTEEEIVQLKNQIFGVDTPFEIETTDTLTCQQFYRNAAGLYEVEWECGMDMTSPSYYPEIVEARQVGDVITLKQAVLFADLDSSLDEGLILSLYQDYDRTRLLGQISYTDTDDYFNRFLDVDVRSYESASQYQFLFQKNEDGTYRFLKFERIS